MRIDVDSAGRAEGAEVKPKPGPTARELQRLRKDVATALKVAATNAQLATNLRHVLSQNDALRARVRELENSSGGWYP